MAMAATCVDSMGMSVSAMRCIHMRMAVSCAGVRVTMCTAGVRVTVVTATVLECKDADDVDYEAENRHDQQSVVMDFWRFTQTLKHSFIDRLLVWLSGRMSVSDRRTFPGLHLTCS